MFDLLVYNDPPDILQSEGSVFVMLHLLGIRQVLLMCLYCLLNVLYYIKFLLILQNALDI